MAARAHTKTHVHTHTHANIVSVIQDERGWVVLPQLASERDGGEKLKLM